MRRHDVLALAFVALALPACTVIVGNQLSKYHDYGTSDTGGSGSQNTDPCALTPPDAGNTCSACIAQKCQGEIDYACKPDGSTKPWFDTMTRCAQGPVEGFVNGQYEYNSCSSYNQPDAQPIKDTDDPAHQRAALICVRDNCYANSATPPCNQCSVGTTKPGGPEVAVLHDTDCGRCLETACGALLVKCCRQGIPDDLKKCAYTQAQEYKATCLAHLQTYQDAGDAAASTNIDDQCKFDLATTCYAQCVSRCQ